MYLLLSKQSRESKDTTKPRAKHDKRREIRCGQIIYFCHCLHHKHPDDTRAEESARVRVEVSPPHSTPLGCCPCDAREEDEVGG